MLWPTEEDDVVWTRVRRKLGGVLAAMDKLIDGTDSHNPKGPPGVSLEGPPGSRLSMSMPTTLQPAELETLRRVASMPVTQRTHDDISAMLHVLRCVAGRAVAGAVRCSVMGCTEVWAERCRVMRVLLWDAGWWGYCCAMRVVGVC